MSNWVYVCRINLGMTQEELAIQIGKSIGYIAGIEKGRSPRIEEARKMADVLNTDINKLFPEEKNEY